jgi:hypothetical protein
VSGEEPLPARDRMSNTHVNILTTLIRLPASGLRVMDWYSLVVEEVSNRNI